MRFWHFGSSPYLFFILLLLFSIVAVMMYEPRFLGNSGSHKEAIAHIELEHFSYYEVGTQGVLSHATGERGYRFAHEDIIEGFNLAQFLPKERRIEQLSTPLGIRRNEVLFFPNGVKYVNGGTFSSQKGEYDLKKRYFKGEGNFEFTRAGGERAQGQNIRYDSERGIMKAESVKAVFLFQEGGER